MGCGASQVAADSGSGYAPAAEAPTTRRSVQNDLPEPQIRAVAGHDYDGAEKGSETETNARREIKRQLTQGLSPDAQLKTHVHQEKVSDNAFFSQSELNERRSDRMSATVAQRKGSLDESLLRQSRASREVDPALMGHVRSSRFHSVSSAFGYVRYCEWVNAEDTSGRKRGRVAVSSETNLRRGSILAKVQPSNMDEYEVQFIAEALKRNLLFEKLSSVQVAQAISLMGKMEVALGERICTQGEEDAKLMYVVLSGAFDVVVKKDAKTEPQKVARVEAVRARNSARFGAIRRNSARFF